MAEALACGTPVLAFGRGGAAEIVEEGKSGYLFPQQSAQSVEDCIRRFENEGLSWDSEQISASAQRFSETVFRSRLLAIVEKRWSAFSV
jgi:glycosyltransferase involved in cell wall biosynthesis